MLSPTRLHRLRTCLVIAIASASLTLAGCHKKSNINPASLGPTDTNSAAAASPTASITADPLAIDLGQSVVLNWRTANADSVTIDGLGPVNPNGTQTVSPTTSTNYHLTAKGDGGTVEANVRVTVRTATEPAAPANTGNGDVTDAAFHAAVQDAFFDYDSYDLRADAKQAVAQAAAFLTQHPTIHVVIGGYCDDRGSAEYNLALGENRANSAKTALVNAGIAAGRIRVVSYGKERQFCTEETDACWQENRRAQFTIDR